MSLTINTKAFSLRRIRPDDVLYVGPAFDGNVRDEFAFVRREATFNRKGENLTGNNPSVRRSKSVVVDAVTGERKLASLGLGCTFPHGMSTADKLDMIADFAAALAAQAVKDALTVQTLPSA